MTDLMHWQKVGPGHDVMIPGLAQAWTIMVDPQFNAKALTNGLGEWLQALERDQIVETGRWDSARLGGPPRDHGDGHHGRNDRLVGHGPAARHGDVRVCDRDPVAAGR